MKQRLPWLLARLALILGFLVPGLAPLDAFAATSASANPSAAQPRPHFFWNLRVRGQQSRAVATDSNNVTYHFGSVMSGTTHVYAIFWEPTGNVSASYNSLLERYFQDVGGSPLYRNNTQYYDISGSFGIPKAPTNTVLAGSVVDRSPYPESPLLDRDIQNEVTKIDASLPGTGLGGLIHPGGLDTLFFVFTEAGQNLCFDSSHAQCASNSFCAYHSSFGGMIYAAMPYAASFLCDLGGPYPNDRAADLTINTASHEQMEATTDPLLTGGWYDSNGLQGEIADKCNFFFGPRNSTGADVTWNGHGYLVQQEWDNQVSGCVLGGP